MSIKSVARKIWQFDKMYLNPDPSEDIELGSFGTMRGRLFHEEGEVEDYFDNFDVQLPPISTQGHGAGRTFFASNFVEGNVKITGNYGKTQAMTMSNSDIQYGTDSAQTFRGEVTVNFSRRNAYMISYSNFTHFKLDVNSALNNKIEEIYKESGRDWRRPYVLVTGRTVAQNCTLWYSTARRTSITFDADLAVDSSSNLKVNDQFSLGDSTKMGISPVGNISWGREGISTLQDDFDAVPFLEFHKLAGSGKNLTLKAVR